jgi:GTPase SAR1 family protein
MCVCALVHCLGHVQVFLGDQSVGKTSIITRFMYDKFDNTYQVGWQQQARLIAQCCPSVHALQLLALQGMYAVANFEMRTGRATGQSSLTHL